jgi:hypothetical protein
MTESTDTTTTRRAKFDHQAIAADLESGMSVDDVMDKYGCSESLVLDIRRTGGQTIPPNVQRAKALRSRAKQFRTDHELLDKWAKNDDPENRVGALKDKLAVVSMALIEAAEMYEALPAAVMETPQRAPATTKNFEAGMIVRVREKALPKWKGVASDTDHLTVTGTRDSHVLVEDKEGSRLFIPRKDLEVRQDG